MAYGVALIVASGGNNQAAWHGVSGVMAPYWQRKHRHLGVWRAGDNGMAKSMAWRSMAAAAWQRQCRGIWRARKRNS